MFLYSCATPCFADHFDDMCAPSVEGRRFTPRWRRNSSVCSASSSLSCVMLHRGFDSSQSQRVQRISVLIFSIDFDSTPNRRSLGREYEPRSSLCMHACIPSQVLYGWMLSTNTPSMDNSSRRIDFFYCWKKVNTLTHGKVSPKTVIT